MFPKDETMESADSATKLDHQKQAYKAADESSPTYTRGPVSTYEPAWLRSSGTTQITRQRAEERRTELSDPRSAMARTSEGEQMSPQSDCLNEKLQTLSTEAFLP